MPTRFISKLKDFYDRARKAPLEYIFLGLFILFGGVFIAVIPPGWNTDEFDHSYRAFQLSRGNLFSEKVTAPNGLKAYGGNVPTSLIQLYDKTGVRAPGAVTDKTVKVDGLYEYKPEVLTLKDDGARTPINFSGAALYSPVAYAVYIPAFWIGHVLSLPWFHIVIIARIFGLLVTAAALFFAIRLIPVGKWVIFVLGLLPVVVIQASSLGADAPQIAVAFLFIALILRQFYLKRSPYVWEYGIFALLGVTLGLIKIVYVPLILLVPGLLLLKKRNRSLRHYVLMAAVVLLGIVPALVWTQAISYIDINSNPQADFQLQKLYVLQEPLLYIKTLYYTFFTNEQAPLKDLFGAAIWTSAPLPALYAYIASTAVICSLFVKSSREKVVRILDRSEKIWRLIVIALFVLIGVLIATALYVYSTTLHQSSIISVQSRYFIPILPLLLLPLYGNIVKSQRILKGAIVCMSVVVLVGSVLAVYHRLYQTLPLILG